MEISPIPGIRALQAVRAPSNAAKPLAVFDIDGTAKPGDGGGSRNNRKAAGAEEDEPDDLMLEGEGAEDGDALEGNSPRRVDYFA